MSLCVVGGVVLFFFVCFFSLFDAFPVSVFFVCFNLPRVLLVSCLFPHFCFLSRFSRAADLFGGFPGAPSILDVTSAPPAAAAAAAVAPFVPAPPIPTSAPAPGGGGSSSALLNAARGQAQANRQLQEARAQHAFESRKKLEEEAARSIAAAAPAQAPPSAADALAEEAARARAAAREAREKQALARDLPDNDFAGGWS